MSEHRMWVIDPLGDADRRTLYAAGIDMLHMRRVSQTPLVIETYGGGNAIVSYGYVALIPISELEPLLNSRRPAISEELRQPQAGILTRLRAWLTAHIFPQEARDEHDDR